MWKSGEPQLSKEWERQLKGGMGTEASRLLPTGVSHISLSLCVGRRLHLAVVAPWVISTCTDSFVPGFRRSCQLFLLHLWHSECVQAPEMFRSLLGRVFQPRVGRMRW